MWHIREQTKGTTSRQLHCVEGLFTWSLDSISIDLLYIIIREHSQALRGLFAVFLAHGCFHRYIQCNFITQGFTYVTI